MKRVQLGITRLSAGLLAVVLCLGGAGRARAEFIFTFAQVGNNVTVTGMGSLNTTGAMSSGPFFVPAADVDPSAAELFAGGPPFLIQFLTPVTGPTNFGPGGLTSADSFSGDDVAVAFGDIAIPFNYVSGDPLSDSDTWLNTTISGLGLTPGTYIYTLPNDTLEVIVPATIPEPSTLTILAAGLGLAGWWRRRRTA